jgi:hypothetical protein
MPRKGLTIEAACSIGEKLPDVTAGKSWGGGALKVQGKLLACQAMHKSAEPNSLMVRISLRRRAELLEANPETYYLKDHYAKYPAILVRLSRINRTALLELLTESWEYVVEGGK